MNCLEFERPIVELEEKINELRSVTDDTGININEEIQRLERKSEELKKSIFSSLSLWQITQLARHPKRPHTFDYIEHIFTEFDELHGDRHFSNAPAIVGGIAYLENQPVLVIGHQKGRNTKENVQRNFGMPRPEGYRKAWRLMQLAERFQLPILTFIDTPGAYPGIDAEERGQSEAIAYNLFNMSALRTPIICTVIGEGGSGGALGIGVGDYLLMCQYSIYSVISPEGCASILWKSAEKASDAAEAMGLSAERLYELGLVDHVVPEPLGGAHRNVAAMSSAIKQTLIETLTLLKQKNMDDLLETRYRRLRAIGIDN